MPVQISLPAVRQAAQRVATQAGRRRQLPEVRTAERRTRGACRAARRGDGRRGTGSGEPTGDSGSGRVRRRARTDRRSAARLGAAGFAARWGAASDAPPDKAPPNKLPPHQAPAASHLGLPPTAAAPSVWPAPAAGRTFRPGLAAREPGRGRLKARPEDALLLLSRRAVYALAGLLLGIAIFAFLAGFLIGRGRRPAGRETAPDGEAAQSDPVALEGSVIYSAAPGDHRGNAVPSSMPCPSTSRRGRSCRASDCGRLMPTNRRRTPPATPCAKGAALAQDEFGRRFSVSRAAARRFSLAARLAARQSDPPAVAQPRRPGGDVRVFRRSGRLDRHRKVRMVASSPGRRALADQPRFRRGIGE